MSAGVVLAPKFGVFAGEAEKQDTVITPQGLEQFGAFLERTGWSTI
jgi:hypothetical protein